MDDFTKLQVDLLAQTEENERLREQLAKAEATIKSLQDKLKFYEINDPGSLSELKAAEKPKENIRKSEGGGTKNRIMELLTNKRASRRDTLSPPSAVRQEANHKRSNSVVAPTSQSDSFETLPGIFNKEPDTISRKDDSDLCKKEDDTNFDTAPISTREKLIREVIETEESYVASLKIAVHMYLVPLNFAATSSDPILSPKEISVIFTDLMMIYNFAKQFLKMLHDRFQGGNSMETEKIGDIFLQMSPFLKSYNSYTKSYDASNETLRKLTESNTKFRKYLETTKNVGANAKRYDITDLLIMPVQRLPRYLLLLTDLKRFTPETHPDYQDIEQATSVMSKVVYDMNNTIKHVENINAILQIQKNFNDQVIFLEPHRNFVREGPITLLNNQNQKKINGYMFLFNDLLVLAKRGLLQGFQLEDKLSMVNSSFETASANGLEVTCDDKSYLLMFKSGSERDEWMETIMSNKNVLMTKTNKRAKWYIKKGGARNANSRRSSF